MAQAKFLNRDRPNLTRLPPSSGQPRSDLGRLLTFWASENYAGREFIRNGRGAARKGDWHFNVNPGTDLQSSISRTEKPTTTRIQAGEIIFKDIPS
jgi:hypothetical protein